MRLALRCPVCGSQLGPDGLTDAHLHRDVRRYGWHVVAAALIHLHAHHLHVVRIGVAADESRTSPLGRRVVEALSRRGTMTLGEVAGNVGEATTACKTALLRLIRRGLVETTSKGLYRWLDGGTS